MSASSDTELAAVVQAATRSGARPFKNATGDWASSVEVALLDTILSIGAHTHGAYGAGVLPRLRAFKAFRGPANMMRVVATLGPFGLADFVPTSHQIDQVMGAAAALLDAGINSAVDVDPNSQQQRDALLETQGVPALAWDYFLIAGGHHPVDRAGLKNVWLADFVERATNNPHIESAQRESLLQEVADELDAEHQRKSFGRMPEFTLAQLHQAIFRAEYARATVTP